MICQKCEHRRWCPDKKRFFCIGFQGDQEKKERRKAVRYNKIKNILAAGSLAAVYFAYTVETATTISKGFGTAVIFAAAITLLNMADIEYLQNK